MDLWIAAGFLALFGVALYKVIQFRREAPLDYREALAQTGKAFFRLLSDGKELVFYALFVAAVVGGLALSLMAFGPQVSMVALLGFAALFLLLALKPPPKTGR